MCSQAHEIFIIYRTVMFIMAIKIYNLLTELSTSQGKKCVYGGYNPNSRTHKAQSAFIQSESHQTPSFKDPIINEVKTVQYAVILIH
jgi:hypothetical protein